MFDRKIFKSRRQYNVLNRIRVLNVIGDSRDKYLEGKIIVRHSRGHDTIILLFNFKGFYDQHVRLLSENYYFR